jgi:ribosome-associated protein
LNTKEGMSIQVIDERGSAEGTSQQLSKKLLLRIADAAANAKGEDMLALDVSPFFDLSDYFVIISGNSDRHVQGICNRIIGELQAQGVPVESVEGFDEGHWALLDFGDVIVHVFYQATRKTYDLEGLWSQAKRISLEAKNHSNKQQAA